MAGTEISAHLQKIASNMAAIAEAGLGGTQDEYDHARYVRMVRLAAELGRLSSDDGVVAIERSESGPLLVHTPKLGVDAAIFDQQGRILLIQRSDCRLWAMPGGTADVGETAAEGAAREAWEETGLQVRPIRLLGVYDSRKSGGSGPRHLYHFTFECVIMSGALTTTNETVGYGYFASDELPPLFSSHNYRVPDALRLHQGGGAATFQLG